ncbi:hypothetical protein HU675_0000445 [Bradyrhizobium septentrionale]|uniref:hypothetical protein n=1 Tax=Bradyrhizobium septentrionale TaxID=1404411 RepID=UPI0015968A09|nr:hypothetical protein [Bradyrhizobium septentrionale]UGY25459.1 hypothetical protein HU675_0000445 [Bradyrhizobium septentrionale]
MGSERIPLRRINKFEDISLNEEHWHEIESQILGTQLDERTREQIKVATTAFGMLGPIQANENSILVSELRPALKAWKRATGGLRRTLRLKVAPLEETFGRLDVILPFLKKEDVKTFGRMLPLELLALSVSSATAAERVVNEEIRKGGASRIKNDLWSVWVCLIAVYLSRAQVKVTVSSGSKAESPFVKVIQSLQSHLPAGCQRFIGSADPYESLANGIKRARRTVGELGEKDLLLILAGWGSGVLKGYQGPLETSDKATIAKFKARAERVLADIERRAAGAAADPGATSTSAPPGNCALAEGTEAAAELEVDLRGMAGMPQDKLS